ncbi:thymidylate synthase [Patescibacteria group bacterium]
MNKSKEKWPKYYNRMILQPNPNGDIGIICGWTKKEVIEEKLDENTKERVAAIGQLYSPEGINYIIRNLFLNPELKYLFVVGLNLSKSFDFFHDFLFRSVEGSVLHKEIPVHRIEEFRNWFAQHTYFVKDEKELSDFVKSLEKTEEGWTKNAEEFTDPEPVAVDTYPSEKIGFRVEDKKVADAWLKVLDRLVRFGEKKKTQYGDEERVLIGFTTIISEEDPEDFYLPDYLTFGKSELDNYFNQIMTDNIPDDLEYTYGSRLRNHGNVNQIENIIEKLKEEDCTRRAVGVLWNVEIDSNNPKPPCLNLIQAVVNDDKLYLTCYIRSNDMFGGWPQNAMAMLKVQEEIARAVGKKRGKLMIVSNDAHFYERDFGRVKEILKKNKPALECTQDPRGSFVIDIEDNKIKVEQMTPCGQVIKKYYGKTAVEIEHQVYPHVSEILHALDLGSELQKAEVALQLGIDFKQDNPLNFNKLNER